MLFSTTGFTVLITDPERVRERVYLIGKKGWMGRERGLVLPSGIL